MDERDWTELRRMLLGLGLEIVSTDRATLTLCVRVPPIRPTRSESIVHEWKS
jgi:hypothetical protein